MFNDNNFKINLKKTNDNVVFIRLTMLSLDSVHFQCHCLENSEERRLLRYVSLRVYDVSYLVGAPTLATRLAMEC